MTAEDSSLFCGWTLNWINSIVCTLKVIKLFSPPVQWPSKNYNPFDDSIGFMWEHLIFSLLPSEYGSLEIPWSYSIKLYSERSRVNVSHVVTGMYKCNHVTTIKLFTLYQQRCLLLLFKCTYVTEVNNNWTLNVMIKEKHSMEKVVILLCTLELYYSLFTKYLSTIQHIMLQCQTLVHEISFIAVNTCKHWYV